MRFALNRYESLIRKITVRAYKQTFKNKILWGKKTTLKADRTGKTSDNYAAVDQNNNATESTLVTAVVTYNNYTLPCSQFLIWTVT